MPWGKIFISHSTKTEQARAFLEAVSKALAKHFHVLLDETGLQAGDDWRRKIYEWIDDAHGAVLLLTPEALKSKFVQIETSVLSWRTFRQPDFVFLPILVGDVKASDLDKGIYGKLAIGSVQVIDLNNPDAVAKKVVKALSQKLRDLSGPRTAYELLIDLIASHLKDSGVTVRSMYEVGASKLSWGRNPPPAGDGIFERLARDLLAAEPLKSFEAVEMLAGRGMKGAKELLDLVAPSWVKAEAAKPIAELAIRDDSKRAIGLEGSGRWTQDSYISRSCFRSLTHKFDVCELVLPKKRDTLADFTQQIVDRFIVKGRYAEAGDRLSIKQDIEDRSKDKPVFVVFPPEVVPDSKLIEDLRREFKTVTFFVLTGGAHKAKLRPLRDKLDFLSPPDPALERSTRLKYTEIADKLS